MLFYPPTLFCDIFAHLKLQEIEELKFVCTYWREIVERHYSRLPKHTFYYLKIKHGKIFGENRCQQSDHTEPRKNVFKSWNFLEKKENYPKLQSSYFKEFYYFPKCQEIIGRLFKKSRIKIDIQSVTIQFDQLKLVKSSFLPIVHIEHLKILGPLRDFYFYFNLKFTQVADPNLRVSLMDVNRKSPLCISSSQLFEFVTRDQLLFGDRYKLELSKEQFPDNFVWLFVTDFFKEFQRAKLSRLKNFVKIIILSSVYGLGDVSNLSEYFRDKHLEEHHTSGRISNTIVFIDRRLDGWKLQLNFSRHLIVKLVLFNESENELDKKWL